MTNTLTIGGLELPEAPVGGRGFHFTNIVDWYAVPESKSEVREYPSAHGAHLIGQDWRGSLALSFSGSYAGDSREDAASARRILRRAATPNVPVTVTYHDALGPTSRDVSIRRVAMPDEFGASEFDFTIHAIATDPNRYGPAVVTSTGVPTAGTGLTYPLTYPLDWGTPGNAGRLTVSNDGDVETSSVLTVTGGLGSGFEAVHVQSGRRIRFERVIPADGVVTLDLETGSAWLDSPTNDVSGFLTRREFWTVPPQSSHDIQFLPLGTVTGSPTLTASTRPAY